MQMKKKPIWRATCSAYSLWLRRLTAICCFCFASIFLASSASSQPVAWHSRSRPKSGSELVALCGIDGRFSYAVSAHLLKVRPLSRAPVSADRSIHLHRTCTFITASISSEVLKVRQNKVQVTGKRRVHFLKTHCLLIVIFSSLFFWLIWCADEHLSTFLSSLHFWLILSF